MRVYDLTLNSPNLCSVLLGVQCVHSGSLWSKEWALGQDSAPSPVAELSKEQKTMEQERVGVQNEVEAQKHSWNVKKVGQWGEGSGWRREMGENSKE